MEKSIEDLIGTGVISNAEKTINGFTILELLVVVTILGIFTVIAYPNISKWIVDRDVKKFMRLEIIFMK